MSATARLGLPYIAPQQAQKQVTYNMAMAALDQLVQPTVKSRTIAVPPGSPLEGDTYVVGPSATGAWAGKDGQFACWLSGGWSFRAPANGWLTYVQATAEIAVYQSGAWSTLVSNGGSSVPKFGINTTADVTNRLAVAADASLFTHSGGSHRLKLNKASSADTASVLYQDNFSGRAELGLTADDAFHVKVSADGSSWFEALSIAQGSGIVSLPIGQLAFPATQNPSSNVNTLDDYEEGTWTPAISFGGASTGVTYSGQTGRYTKIGRLVYACGNIVLSAKGTSTGAAALGGLPFTISNTPAVPIAGAIGYSAGLASVSGPLVALGLSNSVRFTLYQTNSGSSVALSDANFTNATTLYFALTYEAA